MRRKTGFLFFLVVLTLLAIPLAAPAASHYLSIYEHDDTNDVGYLDLVVSLDWEPTVGDRNRKLQTAFEQFARDVFKMTEGKHKIRRLYVYTDSEQMNNADVRIMEKRGRSNALANGIIDSGGRILAYTSFSGGTQRSGELIGHTIAHEFGHYAYGLYDEYKGLPSSSCDLSVPLSGDSAKNSIMNNQGIWQWFSIETDYAETSKRKTAQWRFFESSAWETLVRAPKDDKVQNSFRSAFSRVRYDEFDGMTAPTLLTKPSVGWDSDFEIIYKGGNVVVLVIDKSNSMGTAIDAAKSSAQQFVDLMQTGDRVAVVAFNKSATTVIGTTILVDQAAKDTVKAAIDTITANGGINFSAALNRALSVLDSASTLVDTRFVMMVSGGDASEPSVQDFIEKSIPIFTVGLSVSPSGEEVLKNIATKTGGSYREAPGSSDLADLYAEINRDVLGRLVLLGKTILTLLVGEKSEMTTTASDQESSITFRASWESGDVMSFELEMPDGTIITPATLPPGVTYISGDTYGIYTIESPQEGEWKSIVTADTVSSSGTVSQETSAESSLSVKLQLLGDQYPQPIAILTSVNGPEPIVGATVAASVTVPLGARQIADITLEDDGIPPDLRADDGVYSGVLANYTVDGDYEVTVTVTNPSGTASIDTGGALESGTDAASEILPPFQRLAEGTITTSGYLAQPTHPMNAIEISLDNTIVWGTIENDGDVVWYKLSPIAGKQYFIQTSNLVSRDTSTMATLMTLYEPDASTVIESNFDFDGSNISQIVWTAPSTDTHYLTVEHASPGTGTYAVTGGTTDLYRADAGACGDGGNGGFTGPGGDGSIDRGSGSGGSSSGCFISAIMGN
jgi:Mg-chelatase subunit ChlD